MMLAETEFRHQIEATIRSYRDVLLGLFFITVGMLLDVRLLLQHLLLVTAILCGMLLLKTAVVAIVAEPATRSWFKSIRTGIVVAQGGRVRLCFAHPAAAAGVVGPRHRPAVARRHSSQHGVVARHHPPQPPHHAGLPARIGRSENDAASTVDRATLALAERDHVLIAGFGRVGQNIARVLEQTGFEYIALDLDPYRIRLGQQAGDPGGLRRRRPNRSVGQRRCGSRQLHCGHLHQSRGRTADRARGAQPACRAANSGAHAG